MGVSCKFAVYFQSTFFPKNTSVGLLLMLEKKKRVSFNKIEMGSQMKNATYFYGEEYENRELKIKR